MLSDGMYSDDYQQNGCSWWYDAMFYSVNRMRNGILMEVPRGLFER